MANKRAFTMKVVDSDAFLNMTLPSQALYFHLCLRAGDDGIVRNTLTILRTLDADDDMIGELEFNGFVRTHDRSTTEIVHFHEMNSSSLVQRNRQKSEYRKWRESVLERDGRKCQHCGSSKNLCVHHKIRYRHCRDNEDVLFDPSNGITLCKRCHTLLHKIEGK